MTELLGRFASAEQKPTMIIPVGVEWVDGWDHSTSSFVSYVQEIPSAIEKLESLLGTLELNIKSFIKEFDTKRKALLFLPLSSFCISSSHLVHP